MEPELDLSRDGLISLFLVGAASMLALVVGIYLFLFSRCLASGKENMKPDAVEPVTQITRDELVGELERLKAGGAMNEKIMERLSEGDRILFEVMLIEALSEEKGAGGERLRSNLVRAGLDDLCARRLFRADIPESVRAMALMRLLKQPEAERVEAERDPPAEIKTAAEKA
ncbi:MAG TPA: hypothetical protein VLD57_04480 [Blastocatellia bacterium]|nr:hypothetical protein [Blastocatellia bacterium]